MRKGKEERNGNKATEGKEGTSGTGEEEEQASIERKPTEARGVYEGVS